MGSLCGTEKSHQSYNKSQAHPVQGLGNVNPQSINNYQNNQNNGSKGYIDPVLYKRGARYLIRQIKHEQYAGNVPGGKMPIKLLFSLDKNISNTTMNPSGLSFNLSISDITNQNIYKTMTTVNDLNLTDMTYSNQIITEYFFEVDQKIKIEILYNNKKIVENFVSTAKINGSLNHTEELPLYISGNQAQPDYKLIIVSDPIAEELSRVAISFEMRMESSNSGEFFAVFENTYKNKTQKIYKTEEYKGPYPRIIARDIAFGDLSFDKSNDQDFNIEFYCLQTNASITKIGTVVYSLKLLDNMTHDIKDQNGNVVGKVSITTSRRTIKRFIDYVYGGMQISMICAVDFTASNGIYTSPNSLHYINSPEPNQYEQALRASASIISYYDSDKKFPCYGFGAECGGEVSHCFNLTLTDESEVDGVDGIMKAYKNALNRVSLSGPTYFSFVLQKTIQDIKTKGVGNNYYILLIITDGQITDEDGTRNAIIEASVLPLSIIIVGVGNANFDSMNRLDADDNPLKDARGNKIRDIVQFIKYEMKYALNVPLFSQELLFEVPNQVEGYFRSIGQ